MCYRHLSKEGNIYYTFCAVLLVYCLYVAVVSLCFVLLCYVALEMFHCSFLLDSF